MPYTRLRKTVLFHHQGSLSTCNSVQNCISEFAKLCAYSKEFPREICESSYTLESNFAETRLGGKILGSDVNIRKDCYKHAIVLVINNLCMNSLFFGVCSFICNK